MDSLTKHGAGRLCETIEAFWRGLGFTTVKAERFEVWPGEGIDTWGVRSNLVAGMPPV